MGRKLVSWLSGITLAVGGVLAVYALLSIYVLSRNTPPGSCPVAANRSVMYAALAFCVTSLLLSFLERRPKN